MTTVNWTLVQAALFVTSSPQHFSVFGLLVQQWNSQWEKSQCQTLEWLRGITSEIACWRTLTLILASASPVAGTHANTFMNSLSSQKTLSVWWLKIHMRPAQTAFTLWTTSWLCTTRLTMLTTEDSNHSMSTGCCAAVNHSRCPGMDWSWCLVQQGFLPNLFSLHEAQSMKQRRQLMKVKEISLQHFSIRHSISCLLFSISGYLLVPWLGHGSEAPLENDCCYSLYS